MQPFWLTDLCAEECREWFIIKQYEENFNLYQIQIQYPGKDVIYLCGNKKQRILLGEWLFSRSVWSDSLWPYELSMPGFSVFHHLPQFAQTHASWVGDAIQTSHPLSSPSLPALNLSQHQVFSNESALCIRWPKYWSFSISPSSEYSGLISFRIDWSGQLIGSNAIRLLEIRKHRLIEVRLLAQGHIISKWHIQDFISGLKRSSLL